MSQNFDAIFNQLNPAQQQAVKTIDGPVMVIAGPGTGKTQVLAARIANILLKTDTNPSSILALTFTESAAKNMRQRLVSMIGKTGYYVQIHTFHSFCTDVINSHPEFFPLDRDSQPLSELERFDLFQKVIDDVDLKSLKPLNTPYFYLKDIVKSISNLKREGVAVAEFVEIVEAEKSLFEQEQESLKKTEMARREKLIAKNTELAAVYREYQRRLRESLRFDFDDMIAFVVEAFETQEELLLEYQERLLYFLVDEYQDTNSAQNKVVDLLATFWGESANIFVVGDPNQAIYRFQGASLENVLSFTQRYPQSEVITLTVGYRSPQSIYDAASLLIRENNLPELKLRNRSRGISLDEPLQSVKSIKSQLKLFKAPSQTLESVYVAQSVKKLIEEGVDPTQIAILYRNNSDSVDMSLTLEKWQIRYEIDGGHNVLDEPHICQLLNVFKVILAVKNSSEDGLLFEVMQYPWFELDSLLVMKAARAASKAKVSLIDLIHRGYDFFIEHHIQDSVTPIDFAQLEEFVTQIEQWAIRDATLVFPAWFELVINASGYLPWIMKQPNKIELLNAVNSLFREVKALNSSNKNFQLSSFLEVITTMESHHLGITMEDLNVTQDAVRLSTVHKAKGQEWEHVFLTKCIDGKWGNGSKRELIPLPAGILKNTDLSQKERNEDDRRLFYVAMTRAKTALYLSYPDTIITENRSKSVVGSIFLEEIKGALVENTSSAAIAVIANADEHLAKLLTPTVARQNILAEQEFFQHLVKDFRLSVTALNTYLKSPRQFILESLLKVPTAKPVQLSFGTAVHRALETWYSSLLKTGEQPTLQTVLSQFEEALTHEPLSTIELEKRLAYGKDILTRYYQEHEHDHVQPLFIERFFGFGWSRTVLDDIVLTGRIDRIDWIDKAAKQVCVVDYKTGKPRTAGEIEGKTVSADLSPREQTLPDGLKGAYKRQLLFYKLLTELDKSFLPTVTEGVFEFVEPDKQTGKMISRRFSLVDEEVEQLKDLIRTVMGEIRSLAFLSEAFK